MSALVLDCSVAMAWCFEDECDAYADAALDAAATDGAMVPSLWPLEVANVLLVAERRRRLEASDALRFTALLASLPIGVDDASPHRATGPVMEVARSSGLSAYDAAYLELAMRLDLPLGTRDRALRSACRRSGVSLWEAGGAR